MGTYFGSLRVPGERGPGLGVVIDLTDNRIRIAAGPAEIGDWTKDEVRVHADDDGFHLRAEGEEVILDLTEDARFAVDYGLRSAPPLLRRRMAALMRDDV
jgi:hypothetical protein